MPLKVGIIEKEEKTPDSEHILVRARKALDYVWNHSCLLHGRLWPPKIQSEASKTMNKIAKKVYHGSNITLFWENEAVTLCKGEGETIKIHSFQRHGMSETGLMIKDILNNKGIEVE